MGRAQGSGHREDNGNNLGKGRELAGNGWPDLHLKVLHVQHDDPDDDEHVPTKDDDGEPVGNEALVCQDHIRRRQEELVRHGIQKGTQSRLLPVEAGDQAVETVGDPGCHKDDQGLLGLSIEEKDHQERCKKDAENGKEIGNGHGKGGLPFHDAHGDGIFAHRIGAGGEGAEVPALEGAAHFLDPA